jgi:hypothetical protein
MSPLQIGDRTFSGRGHSTERLGNLTGSVGCIFPHSDKSTELSLSTFRSLENRGVPLSGTPVRPVNCSSFTRIVNAVAVHLRENVLFVHTYLDDWLVRHAVRLVLMRQIPWLISLIESLGWMINQKKSVLQPTQCFEYLGLRFNTSKACVAPADHLILKTMSNASQIQDQELISPRQLSQFLGLINFLADFILHERLRMRPIQHWLLHRWKAHLEDLDVTFPVDVDLRNAMLPWKDQVRISSGIPLVSSPPQFRLFTDSSKTGWGALLNDMEVKGVWSGVDRNIHINQLEMKAILLALTHFQSFIRNQTILVLCDNATAVSYLTHQGGTRSLSLCQITWEIYTLC